MVVNNVNQKITAKDLNLKVTIKPWEKITWPQPRIKQMFKEWADYYATKDEEKIAEDYYTKSVEIGEDGELYSRRSRVKRSVANAYSALRDSKAAIALDVQNIQFDLEYIYALYESHKFEDALIHAHKCIQKYKGHKTKKFKEFLVLLEENIKDCVGSSTNYFFLKNEAIFSKAMEKLQQSRTMIDETPLWKKLRKQSKCDVTSIIEYEEVELSPMELARRKLLFRVYNQRYLNRAWRDVVFLRDLANHHESLTMPVSQYSSPILKDLVCTNFDIVRKFVKMCQARCPIYSMEFRRCPQTLKCIQSKEQHLYRVQYQTKRTALKILKIVREYRNNVNYMKLSKFIEQVMGEYIEIKSFRVMPWKFEFINEVYNTLGLKIIEELKVPNNIAEKHPKDRMRLLLNIKKAKEVKAFVFADQSIYTDNDKHDRAHKKYLSSVGRYEKRMRFAKYPIEKSYLCHELANQHLKNARYNECFLIARRGVSEAFNCNSNLWAILNIILIAKAHTTLHKIEHVKEILVEATFFTQRLKNHKINVFIEMCKQINLYDLELRQRFTSTDLSKKRSRRNSTMFISSTPSFFSTDSSQIP